jgi:hypothetical protein
VDSDSGRSGYYDLCSGASRPGKGWIGDPPHEAPGWYGVYDKDESTALVMKKVYQYAVRLD